jgi:hypothetical protein
MVLLSKEYFWNENYEGLLAIVNGMTRPRPTISSPNEYDAYFRQAQEFAKRFVRCFGLRRTVQSPLFHLLHRERQEGEEWLVFDEEQLQEYAARGFEGFLEWDQALLKALARVGRVASRSVCDDQTQSG